MNKHVYRQERLGESLKRINNKNCKVAYIGSSVTVQKEGYRVFLQQIMCERSGKKHLEINAAIGDTGSITGVFTMEEDVIPYKPDICFVEYMVSDRVKNNTPPDKISSSVEGIVRKLIAIDCEVIFLYRYLEKKLINKLYYQALSEHERIAEHYNLCSINFGSYIQDIIERGEYKHHQLFKDHTHTTKYGAQFIASYISDNIFSSIEPKSNFKTKNNDLSNLNALNDNYFQNTEILYIHQGLIKDKTNFEVGQFASRITNHYQHSKQHSYFAIGSENEFQFDLQGELTGLMIIKGKDSGYIELESSEEKEDYLVWDKWCHYDRLTSIILSKYYSQLTSLKIRIIDKEVDYSECRRTIENPHEITKKLKLVALMVNKINPQTLNFKISSDKLHREIKYNLQSDFYIKEGNQLKEQNKLAQAIKKYDRALQLDPHCVQAHHQLAEIYENLKEFDKAICCYRNIVQKEPNNSQAYAKLARLMMWQGDFQEAIVTYQKALVQKNKQPKWFYKLVYKGLGDAMSKNNQVDEAIAAYQKFIELKSDHPNVYLSLARLYFEKGQLDRVIESYQKAIELKPDVSFKVSQSLAQALRLQGREDEASIWLQSSFAENEKTTSKFLTK